MSAPVAGASPAWSDAPLESRRFPVGPPGARNTCTPPPRRLLATASLGGDDRRSLGLTGDETVSITGLAGGLEPRQEVTAKIDYADGTSREIRLLCRVDTGVEKTYVEHGGVLHYVLRNLARQPVAAE
jgi:hypothetical protein